MYEIHRSAAARARAEKQIAFRVTNEVIDSIEQKHDFLFPMGREHDSVLVRRHAALTPWGLGGEVLAVKGELGDAAMVALEIARHSAEGGSGNDVDAAFRRIMSNITTVTLKHDKAYVLLAVKVEG